jgi:voltage-gated potassium channel
MQSSLKRILIGASFFALTFLGAVIGYMVAGWTFLDAIYMVVITVFGVGYGEVLPIDTPNLKIFTMLVIIAGTSSAVYMVGNFIQMITEGEINRALGARRMTREIETLSQHVIVCGFGRIGQILARRLSDDQQRFVIIDNNHERTDYAKSLGYLVRLGNATDELTLQAAGIDRARCLATVLPDDAINIFITLTAREMNPHVIILARGEAPSTEKKLRLAGANQVVLPAAISAFRIADMITHPAALAFLDRDDGRTTLNELLAQIDVQVDELQIVPHSPMVGATISSLEIRGNGSFIIVALLQANGTTINHPDKSIILNAGDTVIVMGHRGDIPQFARRYLAKRRINYRGASLPDH